MGPLTYIPNDSRGYRRIETPDGTAIMSSEQYYPWVPDDGAYWHLFAAAPDLLAACKLADDAIGEWLYEGQPKEHNPSKALEALRAAIAKADGSANVADGSKS